MEQGKKIKVGIGFATGRKSFLKVLRSYIHSWEESGLVDNKNIQLNVFVAYDLAYNRTAKKDYINIHPDLAKNIDHMVFLGSSEIQAEVDHLIDGSVIDGAQARKIFGKGYASQRNVLIYSAIKHGMDYLIFLDDDEYPMAVTNTRKSVVWGGQHVLSTHIKNLGEADYTHGYHCGYISPIPYMEYDETMTENDFRSLIQAISNDILNWDNVRKVMQDGGVTYADTAVLVTDDTKEVEEINQAKFISGSNLGINLTDPGRVFPFYNPPGARGEDAFLSTCLSERKVIKVPCYTFHDGFSTYKHLLEGLLPIKLKFIKADTEQIVDRFYKACIGWIRYKPLLLFITQPDRYEAEIVEMRRRLTEVLPKVCAYFDQPNFNNILTELDKYSSHVEKHYADFMETQRIWAKLMKHLQETVKPGAVEWPDWRNGSEDMPQK